MKKKLFYATCIIAIAFFASLNYKMVKSNNGTNYLSFANLEALAVENPEDNDDKCSGTNLVPDRYLESVVSSGTTTCTVNGSITIGGTTLTGGYEKGKEYSISIQNKNCSGRQKGACCDQDKVGASVL